MEEHGKYTHHGKSVTDKFLGATTEEDKEGNQALFKQKYHI